MEIVLRVTLGDSPIIIISENLAFYPNYEEGDTILIDPKLLPESVRYISKFTISKITHELLFTHEDGAIFHYVIQVTSTMQSSESTVKEIPEDLHNLLCNQALPLALLAFDHLAHRSQQSFQGTLIRRLAKELTLLQEGE